LFACNLLLRACLPLIAELFHGVVGQLCPYLVAIAAFVCGDVAGQLRNVSEFEIEGCGFDTVAIPYYLDPAL
jgi:hypothetical protein